MQKTKFAIALLAALLAVTTVSLGQTAPDATAPGPFTTTSSEYKLDPTNDNLVAPGVVDLRGPARGGSISTSSIRSQVPVRRVSWLCRVTKATPISPSGWLPGDTSSCRSTPTAE